MPTQPEGPAALTQDLPQASSPRRSGTIQAFAALRNKAYRWYFFSGMGMTAGQGVQQLALVWVMLDLTNDSVGQVGISIFLRGVPMAIIGLVGGVLADRYNRRNLLMVNQLLTTLNLLILASLVFVDAAEVWHVYVSSVLLGATMSLTPPPHARP